MVGLFIAVMVDLVIIVMQVAVNELTFALLNVVVGALIAMGNTAYNSYFTDRAAVDAVKFVAKTP
jgi:hypothetical protein